MARPAPTPILGRDIRNDIGRQLRAYFDPVPDPVTALPPDMAAALQKLKDSES